MILLLIILIGVLLWTVHAVQQSSSDINLDEAMEYAILAGIIMLILHRRAAKITRDKGPVICRTRKHINDLLYELGPHYQQRWLRMKTSTFWSLYRTLLVATPDAHNNGKRKRGAPPNGAIPFATRLAVAIRYFAGACPVDLTLVFGISHAEVFKSVWIIVDAINQCKEFDIDFPESHAAQREMAEEFRKLSDADFYNCIGCIDGILIWTHRPTKEECDGTQCGAKKFLCSRKKRFGLNMQAICDAKNRFVHVSMNHPAATSDWLAFSTSPLFAKLETPGFLHDGLCIFGDNAYLSNDYMITPFKGAHGGTKDAFNFYQSQLRIRIECSFGILLHRFAILRKPMPAGISLGKTSAMVVALCKLHNFCIDCREEAAAALLLQDEMSIVLEGGVPLEGRQRRPSQLLDQAPSLYKDVGSLLLAQNRRKEAARLRRLATGVHGEIPLPRDSLHAIIAEQQLRRPPAPSWHSS